MIDYSESWLLLTVLHWKGVGAQSGIQTARAQVKGDLSIVVAHVLHERSVGSLASRNVAATSIGLCCLLL